LIAKPLQQQRDCINQPAMDSDRIARALARIEAASARIEAVAIQPRPSGAAEAIRKYETLKQQAGDALAQLDRLIGKLEG
jgi:hypothetical protein